MGDLERQSLRRLVDELHAAGVTLPPELDRRVQDVICGDMVSTGARLWAQAHPDEVVDEPCCWGTANGDPADCECWRPVYDGGQAPPQPPASAEELQARPQMCGDCAYRPGSPERASFMAEDLYALPGSLTPFWCHDGMRRPVRWEHPDGRTVAGSPDDWHPPVVGRVAYRADGQPALLCAGWAALAVSARARSDADVRPM